MTEQSGHLAVAMGVAVGAGHWVAGPLICRSTDSRDWLRNAAARTGEISSSPTARKTSRLKRRGFSKASNPWSGRIGSGSDLRQDRAKVAKACCTEPCGSTPTCPRRVSRAAPDTPYLCFRRTNS